MQRLYVLANMSQVISIFLHFEALISRMFNAKIQKLKSDGGTKLKSLGLDLL